MHKLSFTNYYRVLKIKYGLHTVAILTVWTVGLQSGYSESEHQSGSKFTDKPECNNSSVDHMLLRLPVCLITCDNWAVS